MSWATAGALFGRQIMSPREMSISSASRTVTDIGGNASSTGPSAVSIAAIGVVKPGRQHHDLVAGLEHAAGDLAGVAAVVGAPSVDCGRITYCTGNRTSTRLRSEAMCTCSRWCSSDGPSYQGMFAERVTMLSPCSAEIGMTVRSGASSLAANAVNSSAICSKTSCDAVDQVHLVDAQHQVRHPQQRAEERVPAGLLDQALAGVDQDQRQVGGGGAGDHVAGVLDVPGGVGDDELAPRRGEVAVGHVDRDALLALGPQPVGEQRQVGVLVAARRADAPRPPRAGPRRSTWCRRAAGRSASTCRRRRSRRWRTAAGPSRGCSDAAASAPIIRSSPPACGLPWRPR